VKKAERKRNDTVRTGGNGKQLCTILLNFMTARELSPYIVLGRMTLPKVSVKGVITERGLWSIL
jgi:hypothetical protein